MIFCALSLTPWMNTLAGAPAWARSLAFFALWILLWLPLAVPLARGLAWRPGQPLAPSQKIAFVVSLYGVALPLLWGMTRLPAASWAVYGLPGSTAFWLAGVAGVGWALLSLVVVFAAESAAGWLLWRPENSHRLLASALPILGLALGISWTEEAIFRGLLLTWLAADFGWLVAAGVVSLIFALSHLLWEQQDTWPQLPGLVLMGLVLAWARWLVGGHLGLAWGLHAGWIWGLTCLDTAALMQYRDRAPAWVVGRGGQPLAGLAGLLCLGLTAAVLTGIYGPALGPAPWMTP